MTARDYVLRERKKMKKYLMASAAGILAGTFISVQFAGPIIAQETERTRRMSS